MRKPKNSAELFHYWAHQVLPKAKYGNVSYDGPVLYSYAEPIGLLLPGNRVLISNRQFSMTTSSHQSAARSATNQMRVCYAPYLTGRMHEHNHDYWERRAEDAIVELQLHPRRKKSVADRIASAVSSYNAYREFFELDWPEMTSDEMRKLVEETAKQRHEEAVQLAERQRIAFELREKEEAEDLLLWREHATDRYGFTKTALRLSLDGSEIETTRGARVPVDVAGRLWKAVTSCRAHGKHWVPQVEFKVGYYRLTRIESDGTLVIGCHTIPYDELVLMAHKLKLTEDSNGIESDRIEVDGNICGTGNEASVGEHRPSLAAAE